MYLTATTFSSMLSLPTLSFMNNGNQVTRIKPEENIILEIHCISEYKFPEMVNWFKI
jgi:hypothetical protein